MRVFAFSLQSIASMLAVILVIAGHGHAETAIWTGAVSSNWFLAGNWEPAVVPGAGDTAVITSGSPVLSGNTTVAKLTLNAGALNGAGTLMVSQAMEWTGGVVGVKLRIPPGAVLEIKAGTNKFLNAGTIANAGMAVWTGGDPLHFQNAAEWINESAGVLRVQGDGRCLTHEGATGTFINEGAVRKESGGGTLSFEDMEFVHSGRVECLSGTIHFFCAVLGTGTFHAGAGAANLFTRTVALTDAVFSGEGTNDLAGATVTLAGTIQSTNLAWNGGVLDGTSTLHGAMTWYSGIWRGQATLATDAAVTISRGGDKFLAGGVIRNLGIVEWKTWQHLNIQDGAQWINEAGSVLAILENGTYAQNAGALGSFLNHGTVRKQGDAGTAGFMGIPFTNSASGTLELGLGGIVFSGEFNNHGIVSIQGGTIEASAGGVGTGIIDIAAGQMLRLTGGVFDWKAPATVIGGGALEIMGASLRVDDQLGVTNLRLAGAAVTGAGTLTVSQAMEWTGGVVSSHLKIPVGARLEIKAGTSKFLDGRKLTNAGTAVWTGGDPLHFQNAAEWVNQSTGVLEVQGGGRFVTQLGTEGQFINEGAVRKAGGGLLTFEDMLFSHSGLVECLSGSIYFSCAVLGTGTFYAGAGASNLFFRTVGLTNAVFSGDGTNDLAGATVTLTGDIQSTNLAWNGGVLDGAHTLHGALNWYAGVWKGQATLAADAAVTISQGGDKFLAGGVIRNQGMVEWKTWQHLNIQDGAQWINEAGSVFAILENGTYAQNAGALGSFINHGTVRKLGDGGTAGFIGIPLVNHGTLELFAGTLYMNGDYVHSEDAVLRTHLRGPGEPGDFGRLEVAGTIQLAGDLEVRFVGGYLPSADSDYRVITAGRVEGVFSSFTSDLTGTNLYLNPSYSPAGVRLPMVEPTAWFADNGWRGPDGSFHVEIHGVASQTYRVDTSTDLKAWGPLTTLVMPAGTTVEFVDPPSAGRSVRYYRVAFVPGP